MVDVKATNEKLRQRAKNILRMIGGQECRHTDEELERILGDCDGSVKVAAVTIVLGVSVNEAQERLNKNNGVLARVFENHRKETKLSSLEKCDRDLVLCVDAGGTSCKAVIRSAAGASSMGVAGPCNV